VWLQGDVRSNGRWLADGYRSTKSIRMSVLPRSLNECRRHRIVEKGAPRPRECCTGRRGNRIDAAERPHPFQITMRRFGRS